MEIVAPENTTLTNNARHVLDIVQVQQDIQVLTACLKKIELFAADHAEICKKHQIRSKRFFSFLFFSFWRF